MSVHINIPPFFQEITGDVRVVDVNGTTVGECLHELARKFPGLNELLFENNGELMKRLTVFVDGESAYPEGLAKPVQDESQIHIVYLIIGG